MPEFDGVPITLADGKERKLFFDLKAMKLFHSLTGKSLLGRFNLGDLNEEELGIIVWAGLLRDDPDLKREQVDELITYLDITMIISRLAWAFGVALPKAEEGKASPPDESRPAG
jgi:hypothetical protein